jgi:hypothetical protein
MNSENICCYFIQKLLSLHLLCRTLKDTEIKVYKTFCLPVDIKLYKTFSLPMGL